MRARWSVVLVIVVLALGAAPHEAVATGRHAKDEDKVAPPPEDVTPPPSGPLTRALTAADVFSGPGEQLKAVTDSQIRVLQRLIDVTDDSDPEKPDFLFRMAELYAEQQRYYDFRTREVAGKVVDAKAAGDATLAAQLESQRADFEGKAKQWLLDAVKKYTEVANGPKYQSYAKMDQVLFYVAYLLTHANVEDEARVFYKRLLKDFPTSPFLPHAHLSFGEYYFAAGDFENALTFFDKALADRASPIYGYALYMKGWAHRKMNDEAKALAEFQDAVRYAEDPARKGRASAGQLAKEARRDIARSFAKSGSADKAQAFLRKVGDKDGAMMAALAEAFAADGKHKDALAMYRLLLKRDRASACRWQAGIAAETALVTGGRVVDDARDELVRLADTAGKPGAAQTCRDRAAAFLRGRILAWHAAAQASHDPADYRRVLQLYDAHARAFPADTDLAWWRAEVTYRLGVLDPKPASKRFCAAAPQYTAIAALDPPHARRLDAARAAVLAWKNCLDIADAGPDEKKRVDAQRRALRKSRKPARALPPQQAEMLAAFDAYLSVAPDAPERTALRYGRARVLLAHGHVDDGLALLTEVIEKSPASEQAMAAAYLLVDATPADRTGAVIDRLRATPELAKDADLQAYLNTVKR